MTEYREINQIKISKRWSNHSNIDLPVYNDNGEMKSILELYDFQDMADEYLVELEIRNYSRNTIKTYASIIKNLREYFQSVSDLYDERRFLRSFKKIP